MCTAYMGVDVPPGFAQGIWQFQKAGDNDPMICTMGMDLSGLATSYEQAASDFYDAWSSNVLARQPSSLTLTKAELRVGQDGGDPIVYTETGTAVGTGADTYLPQNCAVLVQKRTALGGRRNRGRMYVPYLAAEAAVDSVGTISTVELAAFQSSFNGVLLDLQAIGSGPVVLHENPSVGVPPVPTPITSLVVDARIATQRQRLRR